MCPIHPAATGVVNAINDAVNICSFLQNTESVEDSTEIINTLKAITPVYKDTFTSLVNQWENIKLVPACSGPIPTILSKIENAEPSLDLCLLDFKPDDANNSIQKYTQEISKYIDFAVANVKN